MIRNIKQEFFKLYMQSIFKYFLILFTMVTVVTFYQKLNEKYYNEYLIFKEESIENLEKKYIENYSEELDNSIKNLRERTKSPLIRHNYIIKSNLEYQANSYEKLKNSNLILKYSEERGMDYLVDTSTIDINLIVFVFFIGVLIFNFDRQNKTNSLIASIKNGRLKKAYSKIILYFLLVLAFSFIIYTSYISTVHFKMGFGILDRNIQSLMLFRDSALNISLKQYLYIFVFQKVISFVLISGIFLLIFTTIKDIKLQIISFIAILGVNYLLYYFIGKYSIYGVFKYSTIFSHLNVYNLYGQYSSVYIYFRFLNTYIFSIIFIMCISLISFLISYKIFKKEISDSSYIIHFNVFSKIKIKKLFSFEMYRLYFNSFALLGMASLIIFGYLQINKETRIFNEYMRAVYLYSLREFEGEVDKNKISALKDKNDFYESIVEQKKILNEKYEKGILTFDEKNYQSMKFDEHESRIPGFQRVYDQVKISLEKTNHHPSLHLLDEDIGEYHFVHNYFINLVSIIFYISLIFTVSESFIVDESLKINSLIKSMKKGHSKILKHRIKISYIYAWILFGISLFVYYLFSKKWELLPVFEALVQSVPKLLDFGWMINFSKYLILYLIYAGINLYLFVNVIVYVSQKINKRVGVYLILFIISVIPNAILLFTMKSNIISGNIFSNIFFVNFFVGDYGIIGYFIELIINIIFVILIRLKNKQLWHNY